MSNSYLWLKAVHLIAVIAFMAGMLYLPRLFVYHAAVPKGSPQSELFKVMERRLEVGIMRPAMLIAYATGLALGFQGHWFAALWLNWKLFLVLLMTVVYGLLVRERYRFAADSNLHSARYFRFLNEIPMVLLIAIVVLAVLKPL
ncbi:MAG: CopD family protein [Methylovirgula sp.]